MAEHHLDVLGEMCPLPILRAEKAFQKLQAGDVLVVTTDHSCAMKGIPLHFRKHAARTTVQPAARGIWKIVIVRTA